MNWLRRVLMRICRHRLHAQPATTLHGDITVVELVQQRIETALRKSGRLPKLESAIPPDDLELLERLRDAARTAEAVAGRVE